MRCSTPVFEIEDQKEEKPAFDVSCIVDNIQKTDVAGICDAMTDINIKSK